MITNEAMSIMAERALAYCIRLAALFALSDRRDEITPADFDAALALVSYSVETIAYIMPEAEASEEASMPVKVEAFIREAGQAGRTATEIYKAFAIKASELRDIVAQLEAVTVIKGQSAKGTGGRPSMRYVYTGQPEETFEDDFVIFEADIVENTDDEVSEETNETPVEIPALMVAGCDAEDEEVSPFDLSDVWDEVDAEAAGAPTVAPEPVKVVPVLSDEEWAEVDAAREAEAAEAAEVSQAMTAADAVKMVLSDPETLALLKAALAGIEVPAKVEAVKVRKASKVTPKSTKAGKAVALPVTLFSDETAA
ncbi:hypothetical protein ACFHYQ_27335 [Sphaerimonospora cavernae]|uniref:Uncharacterized protein n=1 Tax=Sphaerimonospora cavernae TaxID=1740611 RepID=A0ABV6UCY0_9ACTN